MAASTNDGIGSSATEDELLQIALMESNDPELISKPTGDVADAVAPSAVHTPLAVHATPMNSGVVSNDDTPMYIMNIQNEVSKNHP